MDPLSGRGGVAQWVTSHSNLPTPYGIWLASLYGVVRLSFNTYWDGTQQQTIFWYQEKLLKLVCRVINDVLDHCSIHSYMYMIPVVSKKEHFRDFLLTTRTFNPPGGGPREP